MSLGAKRDARFTLDDNLYVYEYAIAIHCFFLPLLPCYIRYVLRHIINRCIRTTNKPNKMNTKKLRRKVTSKKIFS